MVPSHEVGDTGFMVDPMPADSPPRPPPPRPELRRTTDDRWVGGVAGGLARTLGLPSWVVRLAIVILSMVGGLTVLAYLALWFFLPDETGRVAAREVMDGNESWLPVAGVVILAIAATAAVGILGGDDLDVLIPLTLIAGGVALLAGRTRTAPPSSPAPDTPAPPVSSAAPEPIGATTATATTTATAPTTATTTGAYPPIPPPRVAPYEVVSTKRPPTPKPPRPRSFLTPLTLSLFTIAGGIVFLLERAEAIELQPGSVLAVAMITIGVVLMLATWVGRARGLIAVGLLLLPVAALTAAVTLPLHKGIGEQTFTPTVPSDELTYEYGIGELRVDLRELPVEGTTTVRAELGIGSMVVEVPTDVNVEIHGEAGAGQIVATTMLDDPRYRQWPDRERGTTESGWGAQLDRTFEAETETADRIVLDVEVGLGEVVIRRDTTPS